MTCDVELGAYLRRLRLAKGVSQSKIAAALGCSRPNVTVAEQGGRRLRVFELVAWARCLGLDCVKLVEHVERTYDEYK